MGMLGHGGKDPADFEAEVPNLFCIITLKIIVVHGAESPVLRLVALAKRIAELADKVLLVIAFRPGFGDLRANRSRRPPYLVRERVRFLFWELLRQLEDPPLQCARL